MNLGGEYCTICPDPTVVRTSAKSKAQFYQFAFFLKKNQQISPFSSRFFCSRPARQLVAQVPPDGRSPSRLEATWTRPLESRSTATTRTTT